MFKFKSSMIWLFPTALLLGSCSSDFTSVKKFGELSAKINELSAEVSDDIYQSCLRTSNYEVIEIAYEEIRLIPSVSSEQINGLKDFMDTKDQLVDDCNRDYKATSENFKGANQVITSYMDALGKLATGSNFSADASIDKIGESIKGLNQLSASPDNPNPPINIKIDAPTVDAGTSIFKVIVNFFIKDYREDKLRQVIACTNQDLHIYLTGNQPPEAMEKYQPPSGGLVQATQEGYIGEFDPKTKTTNGILGGEKFQVNQFRDLYLDLLKRPSLTEEKRQKQLEKIKIDYEQARQLIQEKQNKAQAYIQILQATAVAHNLLNQEFGGEKINPKESPLCSEIIKGKTANLPQANNPLTRKLTDTEIKRVKEILTQYQLAVEISLKQAQKNYN
jgi:hypothetical protein